MGRKVRDTTEAKGAVDGGHALQLLYRFLMSDAYRERGFPSGRIGNGFVMPAVLAEGEGTRCAVRHTLPAGAGCAHDFGTVVVMEVDYERVAGAFVRGRSDDRLRREVMDGVLSGFGA